jgi:arabinofuranosyltransferase
VRGTGVGLAAVGALAVGHALLLYPGFVEDDAYISFRYAQRLVAGQGLSWTEGQPVEGYTDLGWVLLVALLQLLGLDHMDGSRLLGLSGLLMAVGAASLEPGTLAVSPRRLLSGGLSLALTGSLSAWAMGGLEHTFLAGLVAAGALGVVHLAEGGRGEPVVALLLGVAVLQRADAPVLVAGLLLGAVLSTGQQLRWVRLGLLPALLLVGQQLHRLWWFEDWVPNTARVKVSGTTERAWMGAQWVARGLGFHGVLLLGSLAALPAGRTARVWVPGVAAALWCAYVAVVGGDIFAAWRQLVPAVPLLGMLCSEAVSRARLPARAVAGLVLLGLAAHVPLANLGPDQARAREERYEWWVQPMGEAMALTWGERAPLLAVDAAGVLPYWTGFRSLDMLGLNDAWLPRHPPPGWGGAGIGHDLGDPDYVLRSEPDIVVFRSGLGSVKPKWASGGLARRREFRERYQLVKLGVPYGARFVEGLFYVRRDAGPLGLVAEPDRITIPAWFLASRRAAQVRGRTWGVKVGPEEPGVVPALWLPDGSWRAVTEPEGLPVRVICGGQAVDAPFVLPRRQRVDLQVSAPERAWVTGLRLERTDEPAQRCP